MSSTEYFYLYNSNVFQRDACSIYLTTATYLTNLPPSYRLISEQDCMLASFLIGRGKGQYDYAPARALQ